MFLIIKIYSFVQLLCFKNINMDIFDKLIEIRKEKKIQQSEMAKNLKITSATMNRYERKKRIIPYTLLINYAGYLDCELKIMIK